MTVEGWVSQKIDKDTPDEATLQAVWVYAGPAAGGSGPYATTRTGPDGSGHMNFTTVNQVPTTNFCTAAPLTLSNCWSNASTNFCTTAPLGLIEGYEIVSREQTNSSAGVMAVFYPASNQWHFSHGTLSVYGREGFVSLCSGVTNNLWNRGLESGSDHGK